jgi:hypothetical protein
MDEASDMHVRDIEQDFQKKVCDEIRLLPEGLSRYIVTHPFTFDDGDHYIVVLKNVGGEWQLSDEGHTIMHLSYEDIDLGRGGYREIVNNTVSAFGLVNREGELTLPIPELRFGDALFSFIQALVKISDVKYLERERVRSLFMEEFKGFLTELIPEARRKFDYYHLQRDPRHVYPIDCRVETRNKPLFIFGVTSDGKCQTATNIIYWWERQGEVFNITAIHENQEEISRPILARFTDVCGRQFSNLPTNRDRIKTFIEESLVGGT